MKTNLSPIVSKEEADRQRLAQQAIIESAKPQALPFDFLKGNPMARGKAEKVLKQQVRYGDKVITRRQYIEEQIAKGNTPTQSTVTEGKGKGEYWSIGDYDINKTQLDYANFLKPHEPKAEGKGTLTTGFT